MDLDPYIHLKNTFTFMDFLAKGLITFFLVFIQQPFNIIIFIFFIDLLYINIVRGFSLIKYYS